MPDVLYLSHWRDNKPVAFPVIKETEKTYVIDQNGWKRRVLKKHIDGNWEWFSSPEKYWLRIAEQCVRNIALYNKNITQNHHRLAEATTELEKLKKENESSDAQLEDEERS